MVSAMVGISGAAEERLAVVTQTTLSVDDAAEITRAVLARFPDIRTPKQQDIWACETKLLTHF